MRPSRSSGAIRAKAGPLPGRFLPGRCVLHPRGHGPDLQPRGQRDDRGDRVPSGHVAFQYGHPHTPGSRPGYLNQPDDAYVLKDGTITVADAQNCRILFIGSNGRPQSQIEPLASVRTTPEELAYPNGDTPLASATFWSQVHGSYVDEFTRSGKLVWSTQLPITYPSDPHSSARIAISSLTTRSPEGSTSSTGRARSCGGITRSRGQGCWMTRASRSACRTA